MPKKKVEEFLRKYNMDCGSIDISKTCELFIEEMQKGLAGKDSSLKMIPTYIDIGNKISVNEPVIVMDAGGTNFRIACIYFDKDRKPVIDNIARHHMPGTKEIIGKDEFFETICEYMVPVLNKSDNISFCFSRCYTL